MEDADMLTRRAVLGGIAIAGVHWSLPLAVRQYVLTPWLWDGARWVLPPGTHGVLDLRTLPHMGTAGQTGGLALAVVRHPTAWQKVLTRTQATHLATAALLAGDPTGLTACKPLMPTVDNWLTIRCGGEVWLHERFVWGQHAHTPQVQAVHHADFVAHWQAIAEGWMPLEALQRIVAAQMQQYALPEWRPLVPARFWRDFPGPAAPATIIADTFNRANSSTLGTSSDGDWDWTEDNLGLAISSNQVVIDSGTYARARADKNLSSAHHVGQASIGGSGFEVVRSAVLVRRNIAAGPGNTAYYGMQCNALSVNTEIIKVVNNITTELEQVSSATGSTDTVRLVANGSQLRGLRNGVLVHTLTDTAVSGFVRTGIAMTGNGGTGAVVDNFRAEDLPPQLKSGLWFFSP
jgi:hypothetical protein